LDTHTTRLGAVEEIEQFLRMSGSTLGVGSGVSSFWDSVRSDAVCCCKAKSQSVEVSVCCNLLRFGAVGLDHILSLVRLPIPPLSHN
jgi:hypothetical protein